MKIGDVERFELFFLTQNLITDVDVLRKQNNNVMIEQCCVVRARLARLSSTEIPDSWR